MSLIEVKNNLLKFCYEDNLVLSGFVRVTDDKNSYIAQVLHLEATRIGKVAIAKILFMLNGNELSSYNGSIPSLRAEISPIDTSILLNTLEKTTPLNIGTIAQQEEKLYVDLSVLNDNPIICAEKFFATKIFLNNLAIQLQVNKKKVVVFDTVGIFNANKLTLGKDFKLPLNAPAINFIYENGFADATAESKALIQNIFEELEEYAKTVSFIPFNTFKAVVDNEFTQTKLIQLVLLRNKIKQIGDLGIYGEDEQDFAKLTDKILNDDTIVIDISNVNEAFQKECIKYVYTLLEATNQEYYSFLPLSNSNSDKALLNSVYSLENTHTTVICGYDYRYLNALKQTSKNMFMFTPLKQQKDFGGYNIFLQKLAEDEFIAYGKMTKFVPLISKLQPIKSADIVMGAEESSAPVAPPIQEAEKVDNALVEKFVNTITPESVNLQTEPVTEEILEEVEEQTSEEETETVVDAEQIQETATEETVVEEAVIQAEENETEEQTEEQNRNQILEELANEPMVEYDTDEDEEEEAETAGEELQQALNEVPDTDDDEELSDDDLDMIEEMSTPDEEIEAIAETPAEEPQQVPQENVLETEEPVAEPVETTEEVAPTEPVAQPVVEPVQPATPPVPPTPQKHEVRENTTNPRVPEYSSDIPEEDKVVRVPLAQGDKVTCDEFGNGVVEKMINYGDKELCSINFESVGRRLLNPELTEIRKI